MAKVARSVVDVILGEAGGKTAAERYRDMVAIASVISNRARLAGVPPQDVVAVQREFNAYNKALPAGVEQYRAMAEMSLNHVQAYGPSHNGTYYATAEAAKNLPGGLKEVARTAGHVYSEDPEFRSFRTAKGFVKPDPQLAAMSTKPNETPTPSPRPAYTPPSRPRGLAALAPNGIMPGLAGTALTPQQVQQANAQIARAHGLNPNQIDVSSITDATRAALPATNIVGLTAQAANRVVPGLRTSLISGMEPVGTPPVNARHRHPLGYAGDFDFYMGDQRITDRQIMHDIAMDMAARHQANIGYAEGNYMGAGRMHVDTLPTSQFPGSGTTWGQTARQWGENLDFARETGIGPTPYTNAPIPGMKPTMVDPAPAHPVGGVDRAPLADLPPAFTPSPRQAQEESMASLADMQAGTSAIDAYSQLARTMQEANVTGLGQMPEQPPAPVNEVVAPPVYTPPAPVAVAPPVQPPVQPVAPPVNVPPLAPPTFVRDMPVAPINTPQAAPQAPMGFRGAQSVYDVYSGLSDSAVASNGNIVSRDSLGNMYNYNPNHDVTTISLAGGRSTTKKGNAFTEAQEKADLNAQASAGMFSKPQTNMGGLVRGVGGSIAGGLLGGMLGPIGGMVGAAIGRELATGNNPFSRNQGMLRPGELQSALSGYQPGLGFPTAPSAQNDRRTGNPSHAQMSRVSPAAANAISKGRAGLY